MFLRYLVYNHLTPCLFPSSAGVELANLRRDGAGALAQLRTITTGDEVQWRRH